MRIRAIPVRASLLLAALLAAGACDDTPAPEPGFVTVSLVSPAGAEGAAVFRVEDEEVTRAETDAGAAFVRQAADGTRIVVVRDDAGTVGFRMEVENIHQPPPVEVLEVSGPDDTLRPSLTGYRAEVGG